MIQAGTTVTLTRSPAQARQQREAAALARKASGATVWESPRIEPMDLWARQLWLASWPVEQQLHPVQELVLCENLVRDHEASVLSRTDLARALRQAFALAEQFRLPLENNLGGTQEQQQLCRWKQQRDQALETLQGLSNAQVEVAAAAQVRSGAIAVPETIIWLGDDLDLTLAQRDLLQACREQGATVTIQAPHRQEQPAETEGWLFESDEDMWLGTAVAIREHLKQQPDSRVMIVVDNAEASRRLIDPALREALTPQSCMDPQASQPWRYSAGLRLTQYALVNAAIQIMRFDARQEDVNTVFGLLHNPVIFSGEMAQQAARIEQALRRDGGDRISLDRLLKTAAATAGEDSPVHQSLSRFAESLRATPSRALPSQWIDALDERLAAFGWPNVKGGLPQALHQEMEQWREACATFQALDAQTGPISHADAARLLRETAATRRFTPRSRVQAQIDIVELDELKGLQADLILLCGLSENSFPRPVQRNPFIPQNILQEHGVPYSSPADCVERGRALLRAVRHQARRVIACAAAQTASGVELLPSPLVSAALGLSFEARTPGETAWRRLIGKTALVATTERPVPVSAEEKQGGSIRGGTQILKSTAQSPLLAFIRHRLNLRQLDQPSRLSASTQGDITHRALERLMLQMPSSEHLFRMQDDWPELIEAAIDGAMHKAINPEHYGSATVRIERGRQIGLLQAYLQHELERSEPFTVIAREARLINLEFHGLTLNLAIDRIDRVATAEGPRDLLIDYKTGSTSIGGWDVTALSEPQLPLYGTHQALAALNALLEQREADDPAQVVTPVHCDGLCFAEVNAERPAFKALTNWAHHLIENKKSRSSSPSLIEDWPGRQEQWQERLRSMTACFLAGELTLTELQDNDLRYEPDLARLLKAGMAPGCPATGVTR